MDRSQAVELLNEIVAFSPNIPLNGFYIREIRLSPTNRVELRLLAELDSKTKKDLQELIAKKRLAMSESKGLHIIY